MKKLTAMLTVLVLLAACLPAALAAQYQWGGGTPKPESEQGVDGWYYVYVKQMNAGDQLDPTQAKECVWTADNASWGECWQVPEADLTLDFWEVWTDIGAIWDWLWDEDGVNNGQVYPYGADAVIMVKWAPPEEGVYAVSALIKEAGCHSSHTPTDGCFVSVWLNGENLYFADLGTEDALENVMAFEGELALSTDDALYFAIDPKGSAEDNIECLFDEYVIWNINIETAGITAV